MGLCRGYWVHNSRICCHLQDGDDGVMLVIDDNLVNVVMYPAPTNLAVLIRDNLAMPRVVWM